MMPVSPYRSLRLHLLLLAAAEGAIFWYAIEKLYYMHAGVTLSQLVALGMFCQASKIVFELPTSIFADRWSRRGTLLASCFFMIVSCLVLGLSSSLPLFYVGLGFWSLRDALRSGVYEAFAYDSLKAQGLQKRYQKIYTRMVSVELSVLTVAGLLAGWLGSRYGLHLTFFASIVPMILGGAVLLHMQEPPISRTKEQGENWLRHLAGSAKIMRQAHVRWTILLMTATMGVTFFCYEYYQLLGLDVKTPESWFGVLIGAATLGMVAGAELSHKQPGTKAWIAGSWATIAAAMLFGLRLGSTAGALLTIFVLFVGIRILRVYLEVYLHDHIPSERRATIFSLSGSLSYIWFFGTAGVFSLLLPHIGTRTAMTVAFAPLLALGVLDLLSRFTWAVNKTAPLDKALAEADHVH
jgi:predicted MFS family arabinose efflux permease